MKKLFIAVLAVAALASCAQDEVIGNYNRGIIGFGNTFVDNVTKALYEGDHKVSSFELYGTVEGTYDPVALYKGVTVSGTGYDTIWTQTEGTVQYWLPSCTYNFYAIVDATSIEHDNGVPTKITYTVADETAGKMDLLYGTVTATTNETATPFGTGITAIGTDQVVAFTLNHLLSKVSFKFTSGVKGTPYTYAISDLKLAGAYATGTYTFDAINGDKWVGSGSMANKLAFSNIASVTTNTPAAESYVIIPGKPELTITFNAQVSYNGTPVSTIPYTLTVNDPDNSEDAEQEFVKNTHYNFSITLPAPGKEIKFAVDEVGAFADGGNVNVQ